MGKTQVNAKWQLKPDKEGNSDASRRNERYFSSQRAREQPGGSDSDGMQRQRAKIVELVEGSCGNAYRYLWLSFSALLARAAAKVWGTSLETLHFEPSSDDIKNFLHNSKAGEVLIELKATLSAMSPRKVSAVPVERALWIISALHFFAMILFLHLSHMAASFWFSMDASLVAGFALLMHLPHDASRYPAHRIISLMCLPVFLLTSSWYGSATGVLLQLALMILHRSGPMRTSTARSSSRAHTSKWIRLIDGETEILKSMAEITHKSTCSWIAACGLPTLFAWARGMRVSLVAVAIISVSLLCCDFGLRLAQRFEAVRKRFKYAADARGYWEPYAMENSAPRMKVWRAGTIYTGGSVVRFSKEHQSSSSTIYRSVPGSQGFTLMTPGTVDNFVAPRLGKINMFTLMQKVCYVQSAAALLCCFGSPFYSAYGALFLSHFVCFLICSIEKYNAD
eukprot:g4308.t1